MISTVIADNNTILLKSRYFVPNVGINSSTKAKIESIPDRAHVLLQLNHIPNNKEKQELKANGTELLSFIPNKGYFASIPSNKSQEIANLSIVRSITDIYPNDKIESKIIEEGFGNYSDNGDGTVNLTIMFHEDVSLVEGKNIILNYSGKVLGNSSLINALIVTISNSSITVLAENDTVLWINEVSPPDILFNDGSRAAISANEIQDLPYNLKGTGVIVGMWDGGNVSTKHEDLRGRVTNVYARVGIEFDPHATHVAGTLGGNGSLSEQEGGEFQQWRGIAPNVTFFVWDTSRRPRERHDQPEDHEEAINIYNIDLSQNSWGMWTGAGAYREMSIKFDKIVRGIYGKKIPVIFASGNWLPGNYPEPYTVAQPGGTAKNTISVGATDSNNDDIWNESRRGPTDDGRIKPDIVAPGCEDHTHKDFSDPSKSIWSTYAYLAPNYPWHYHGNCGTSMAAPVVSGSVALMLEFWRRTHSADPLPSTIKAVLIQTAKDLNTTGPDYVFSYGRINVTEAIHLLNKTDKGHIIESMINDHKEKDDYYTFTVPANQMELKITLVWDDYPGTINADPTLVNDLDLVVFGPNGQRYYPWTLDPENPGDAAVRDKEDDRNNVEQFYINTTHYGGQLTGIWNISVNGTSVPVFGGQTYSLVSNFPLRDSSRVHIRDSSGEKVAWLGNLGNIVLKGSCAKKDICNAPDDSLVFKNANGVEVAYIDPNGNLCIVTGDCSDNSPSCNNPTGDSFIIKEKWSIYNSIYIDITGDLCLIGTLYENSDATMLNL